MKIRAIVLFLVLSVPAAFAQFDATVLGTVTDPSGSAVPGAQVKLVNTQTDVAETTTTSETGEYRFLSVPIGRYTVTVQAKGFQTATTAEVVVDVAARQRVDVRLVVGELNQTVTVQDAAATVETDTSNRGQTIRNDAIVSLPLNGRNYADLALLAPGVRKAVQSNTANRDAAYDINGMRSAFNSFNLDGLDNNAYGTSNQGFSYQVIQAAPDAVQEFRFDTNNYSAEYGRAAGAVINASIRSGTNQFHGSAWEFLRNTRLNAVGYFKPTANTKPAMVRNQFGGAFGGPIRHNKLFFFTDYEGYRSSDHAASFLTVPTPAQKQGYLGVNVVDPITHTPYSAGTAIPMTAFARKVLSNVPDPNLSGTADVTKTLVPANNYLAFPRVFTPSDKGDGRIDYYLRSNLTLFGRFSARLQNQLSDSALPGPSGSGGDLFRSWDRSIAIGATWNLTPASVLDFRLGLTRMEGADFKYWELDNTPGMYALYGISGTPETKPIAAGLDGQKITGLSGFGHDSGQHQYPEVYNPKASYSHVLGAHTLKAGVEFQQVNTEILDLNPLNGQDTYAGKFSKPPSYEPGIDTSKLDTNIFNIADFMFGAPDTYSLSSYSVFQYRQQMYFGYVQDDIKVSHRLTVNVGLRYEFATPQYEANNNISNFDPVSKSMVQAHSGSLSDRALVNPDPYNFGPRAGLAYSINPKTVIRSAYGISYMHFNRSGRENLLFYNPPLIVNALVTQTPSQPLCTGDQFNNCFRPVTMGFPTSLTSATSSAPGVIALHYIPKDTKSTYVQSWHFTIQRELARDLVLDVGYVGNRSVHLYQLADYNQAPPNLPGQSLSLAARRPVPAYGAIQIAFNEESADYNALQVKLEKRFSKGLMLLNSFAFAKSIDVAPSNMETGNNSNYYMNFYDRRRDKAVSDYDQPFQNTTALVWDVPVGKGRKFGSGMPAVADAVAGGWRITGINTMISGQPINFSYTPTAPETVVTNTLTMRPNLVGNPFLPASQRTPQRYFDISAFRAPDTITDPATGKIDYSHPFGNAGRNIGRSDAQYTLDLGIDKSFRVLSEGRRLEFRAEAFNLLNKTNFQAAASNISSPGSFGTITKTFPARQMQLALKFTF
jgi:hypothetical protein